MSREESINTSLPVELALAVEYSLSGLNQDRGEAQIYKILEKGVDWSYFLHVSMFHGLFPLVFRGIARMQDQVVPNNIFSALKQAVFKDNIRSMQLIAELLRIINLFEAEGVQVVVIKGIPLAQMIYCNLLLRPAGDIDILVHPTDVDRAHRIIVSQGYAWDDVQANLSPGSLRRWMKDNQHFEYRYQEKVLLELHWQLGTRGVRGRLKIGDHLKQVKIAGNYVKVLKSEEMFLYLILHGAEHMWDHLKWLNDINLFIRQGNISWEDVYRLANDWKVTHVLHQALLLSKDIFKTPIPEEIVARAINDDKAQKLVNIALDFFANNKSKYYNVHPNSKYIVTMFFKKKHYDLLLFSSWRDKIKAIYRWYLPTDKDLEMVALPKRLYFAYFIIAAITWTCQRLRNLGLWSRQNGSH